jgi:hypothetical protein
MTVSGGLPDLSVYRHATHGFPYVVTLDSGLPGPRVLITALTHGNETAGAIALDRLIRSGLAPVFGCLQLCFVNYRAYQVFDPASPHAARFLQRDMNRLWHDALANDTDQSWETQRAQELLPLVEACDFLLDLHSMARPAPPLALIGNDRRHLDLIKAVGQPEWVMVDPGHTAGPRLIDYRHFRGAESFASAILLECGAHDDPASADKGYEMGLRFLAALHMIEADAPEWRQASQRLIDITHTLTPEAAEDFSFASTFEGLSLLPEAGTLVAHDGGREIRTPYDDCVLLMPTLLPMANATALRFGRPVALI